MVSFYRMRTQFKAGVSNSYWPHEALKRSRGPQFGRDKAPRAAVK